MGFSYCSVYMGCDPEFFFQKNGKIIGSEKVIDIKEGFETAGGHSFTKFIVDGVQAELNPGPEVCRAYLANSFKAAFRALKERIDKDPDLSVNFSSAVQITKEELETLDESSRKFGCAPSKNTSVIKTKMKDPNKYLYRSAGGHIHLGRIEDPPQHQYDANGRTDYNKPLVVVKSITNAALDEPERLVRILDIVLGNTCVLMDRDPSNVERRKVYGRAGEYRVPKHGLEYRTLSNFWLKAYPLMSFVMTQARWAVNILGNSISVDGGRAPTFDYEADLLKRFDLEKVQRAINENNFELAKENFEILKKFISDNKLGYSSPINQDQFEAFDFFISKELSYWFPFEPVEHWSTLAEGHHGGWETFMQEVVEPISKTGSLPQYHNAKWKAYAKAA